MTRISIKEKIIEKSIKSINKRLRKIDEILNANPLVDIINIDRKAQKIIESKLSLSAKGEAISRLAKRRKDLFQLAKRQTKTTPLIKEKVTLMNDLGNLLNEQYLIDMEKSRQLDKPAPETGR